MKLRAKITDLLGNHLATVTDGIEVVWPLNDSRTGKLDLSIYNPALAHVRPLSRLVFITYGPSLIFGGYVVKPIYKGKEGRVEVNLHDATLKLKHHYHRFGDPVVDVGYPLDGLGMRILIESSVPIEPQLDRGVPSNGILWGFDTAERQPAKADGGLWAKAERGSNVWDSYVQVSQLVGGPDFTFDPINEEHPPRSGVHLPGYFAQMTTRDRIGEDKTADVHFEFNYGRRNAEDFVWEPDGDAMRNYWVEVNPGGERSRADQNRGLAHIEASWLEYGIYGGWESAGSKLPKDALTARAQAFVAAYGWPPDYFTVDPKPDGENVPRLGVDYTVGDTILASGKRGLMAKKLEGRVVQATVKQRDKAGGANVSLECIPRIDSALAAGDEGTT